MTVLHTIPAFAMPTSQMQKTKEKQKHWSSSGVRLQAKH